MNDNSELRTRVITAGALIGGLIAVGVLSLWLCAFQGVLLAIAFLAVFAGVVEYVKFATASFGGLLERVVAAGMFLLPAAVLFLSVIESGVCYGLWSSNPLALLGLTQAASIIGLLSLLIWSGRTARETIITSLGEWSIAAVLFVFGAPYLILLAAGYGAFWGVAWLVTVVAINDSAAYFAGRAYGKRRLAPALSPNKTVIGSAAGLVGGTAAGFILFFFMPDGTAAIETGAMAAGCVAAAQIADLLKSMLKRIHGVKDSGSIFPGHGGVLDRIDGLLGAAPIFYLASRVLGIYP